MKPGKALESAAYIDRVTGIAACKRCGERYRWRKYSHLCDDLVESKALKLRKSKEATRMSQEYRITREQAIQEFESLNPSAEAFRRLELPFEAFLRYAQLSVNQKQTIAGSFRNYLESREA